jgi:hypothetical protein
MFDGTIPVEIERLKKMYREIDQVSIRIAAIAQEAFNKGLSFNLKELIDSTENQADDIKRLFDGILTDSEQEDILRGK